MHRSVNYIIHQSDTAASIYMKIQVVVKVIILNNTVNIKCNLLNVSHPVNLPNKRCSGLAVNSIRRRYLKNTGLKPGEI